MSELRENIAAYEAMRAELELSALGKWVLFHDQKLIGQFDDFEAAAVVAVRKFGRGPYLIRQVGSSGVTLPAAALYHPIYA